MKCVLVTKHFHIISQNSLPSNVTRIQQLQEDHFICSLYSGVSGQQEAQKKCIFFIFVVTEIIGAKCSELCQCVHSLWLISLFCNKEPTWIFFFPPVVIFRAVQAQVSGTDSWNLAGKMTGPLKTNFWSKNSKATEKSALAIEHFWCFSKCSLCFYEGIKTIQEIKIQVWKWGLQSQASAAPLI